MIRIIAVFMATLFFSSLAMAGGYGHYRPHGHHHQYYGRHYAPVRRMNYGHHHYHHYYHPGPVVRYAPLPRQQFYGYDRPVSGGLAGGGFAYEWGYR